MDVVFDGICVLGCERLARIVCEVGAAISGTRCNSMSEPEGSDCEVTLLHWDCRRINSEELDEEAVGRLGGLGLLDDVAGSTMVGFALDLSTAMTGIRVRARCCVCIVGISS